jgi:hypothetical protein
MREAIILMREAVRQEAIQRRTAAAYVMREAIILMREAIILMRESGRVRGGVLFATDRVTKLLLELEEKGGSIGVPIAAAGPTVAALAAAAALARGGAGGKGGQVMYASVRAVVVEDAAATNAAPAAATAAGRRVGRRVGRRRRQGILGRGRRRRFECWREARAKAALAQSGKGGGERRGERRGGRGGGAEAALARSGEGRGQLRMHA